MEWISENIDILIQAPLAVLVLVFIWIHNKSMSAIVNNMHKVIEKLIDKLK